MLARIVFAALTIFAAAASAGSVTGAESSLEYLLLANTSSHPFRVSGMTVGGQPCAACNDRTVAPGTAVMLRIGGLGERHLKLTISGGGTCHFDIVPGGSSQLGDCGSTPKVRYVSDVHDELLFQAEGTPAFTLIYAYDPPRK